MTIHSNYEKACAKTTDINQLLPIIFKYSKECDHITEMGVRDLNSTWALLAGSPKKMNTGL